MTFEELRHTSGLTCQEVADIAGVNIRQVFRWQAGEARVPKLVTAALESVLREQGDE